MKTDELSKFVGVWCLPITKEFEDKKEIKSLLPLSCETRYAKTKDNKWYLVRKLREDDLVSIDFIKYLKSLNLPELKANIDRISK